jgi:hypothetical protein
MGALPRLDQPSCLLTSCGVLSVAGVRVVLVMRVVAQRRLGRTMSANTRWAVRLSPVYLSVQASVVTVPCAKTRSSFASDSMMLFARVLNARTTWRVSSASTHSRRCLAATG